MKPSALTIRVLAYLPLAAFLLYNGTANMVFHQVYGFQEVFFIANAVILWFCWLGSRWALKTELVFGSWCLLNFLTLVYMWSRVPLLWTVPLTLAQILALVVCVVDLKRLRGDSIAQ